MADKKELRDITLGEVLMDPAPRDPTWWACCVLPSLMGLTVVVGLFYRFVCWAFFS